MAHKCCLPVAKCDSTSWQAVLSDVLKIWKGEKVNVFVICGEPYLDVVQCVHTALSSDWLRRANQVSKSAVKTSDTWINQNQVFYAETFPAASISKQFPATSGIEAVCQEIRQVWVCKGAWTREWSSSQIWEEFCMDLSSWTQLLLSVDHLNGNRTALNPRSCWRYTTVAKSPVCEVLCGSA